MGVGYLTGQGGGGSNVKSIQKGITAYVAKTSLDITINSVDLSKAVILFCDSAVTSATVIDTQVNINAKLVNSTTLRISTMATWGISSNIHWCVVEFNNVKSLQSGEYSETQTLGAIIEHGITISNVNPLKSLAFAYAKSSAGDGNKTTFFIASKVTSDSQLSIYRRAYTGVVNWQVIEFK